MLYEHPQILYFFSAGISCEMFVSVVAAPPAVDFQHHSTNFPLVEVLLLQYISHDSQLENSGNFSS